MKNNIFTRRDFFKKSIVASGGIIASGSLSGINKDTTTNYQKKLPREITIATVSQEELNAKDPMDMQRQIMNILKENVHIYNPDIICLPEIYPFVNNEERNISLKKKVEISSFIVEEMSEYSRTNQCYIVCPLYTTEGDNIYNAAVIIDRVGRKIGEYRKIHTTLDEMSKGVSPGAFDQPLINTDFGKIGIQICFDIEYEDGWKHLRNKGADIIFWPSAFSGGQMVSTKAWENRCVMVSSAWKDSSRIYDITGDVIAETGRWNMNFISGKVNLEKAFLHTWPSVTQFEDILIKYGNKINIKTYHEEEWSIIESLSPEIHIADILKEFNLRSRQQLLKDAENRQNELR